MQNLNREILRTYLTAVVNEYIDNMPREFYTNEETTVAALETFSRYTKQYSMIISPATILDAICATDN